MKMLKMMKMMMLADLRPQVETKVKTQPHGAQHRNSEVFCIDTAHCFLCMCSSEVVVVQGKTGKQLVTLSQLTCCLDDERAAHVSSPNTHVTRDTRHMHLDSVYVLFIVCVAVCDLWPPHHTYAHTLMLYFKLYTHTHTCNCDVLLRRGTSYNSFSLRFCFYYSFSCVLWQTDLKPCIYFSCFMIKYLFCFLYVWWFKELFNRLMEHNYT